MKIAIVGAGFAGLATCWHLLQKNIRDITLFDPLGVGGAASGMSAGLLHTFTGMDAKLAWHAEECMQATTQLLSVAEKALGQSVAARQGILRVAASERQQTAFFERSQQYPELRWLSAEEAQQLIHGLAAYPALLLPDGMIVQPRLYLQGLWQACQSAGAKLQQQSIHSLRELHAYDRIVVTAGAETTLLPELSHLPIRPLKGQVIELSWPEELSPLPMPLNSDIYLIHTDQTCLVGATFERQFTSPESDPELAESLLRPKAEVLIPLLRHSKLISCRAGVRATTPNHEPLVKQLDARTWVLTGLGSKGLLYHAYLAQQVAEQIRID